MEPLQLEQSVSALLSITPHSDQDYTMSLADISKAFADVGKLTWPDTWPMWKFRVKFAMQTIINYYSLCTEKTVPSEITCAVFNVMTGHIADNVMANYLNKNALY